MALGSSGYLDVTWPGVRSESVKMESFDINHVMTVACALGKVFCFYPSWECSKELHHYLKTFQK